MFICLKRFILIVKLVTFKCFKEFLSLTFLEVNNNKACALNNNYVVIQKTMSPQKSEEDVIIVNQSFVNPRKGRSGHSQMFFKIDVL